MTALDKLKAGEVPRHNLTHVIEEAGAVANTLEAENLILPFLQHEDAVVREGALYALSHHLNSPLVIGALRFTSIFDSHAVIREVASEILEDA